VKGKRGKRSNSNFGRFSTVCAVRGKLLKQLPVILDRLFTVLKVTVLMKARNKCEISGLKQLQIVVRPCYDRAEGRGVCESPT